jgi:hypothetical protein
MVYWATVWKPKEFGGLEILNAKFLNIALMLKWIWKLYQNAERLWVDLIRAKYLDDLDLFSSGVPTHSSNYGMSSRRSSGTSNWRPNTRFAMGGEPISCLTGGWGRVPAH